MSVVKNVLVPTDFGAAAGAALAHGREVARAHGAALHVLWVADDLLRRYALDMAGVFLPKGGDDIAAVAPSRVEALLSDDDRRHLRARAVVVEAGSPAAAIADYARTRSVDVIVMGTSTRGPLSRLLMSSVTDAVARTAPCPVLRVSEPVRERAMPVRRPVETRLEPVAGAQEA